MAGTDEATAVVRRINAIPADDPYTKGLVFYAQGRSAHE